MKIIDCEQGSEVWENVRRGIPTASNFSRMTWNRTRNGLGKSSLSYRSFLIAQRARVYIEPLPSFWMERGIELEPEAVEEYERITKRETHKVGFVLHDWNFGCSPDRFVGDMGLLEVKCPAPEKHIDDFLAGVLPKNHIDQVYGQLWICERAWCDFVSYCPELKPLIIRVERDERYEKWLEKFMPLMSMFLAELESSWARIR